MRCLLAACLLLVAGCTADNQTFGAVQAPDDDTGNPASFETGGTDARPDTSSIPDSAAVDGVGSDGDATASDAADTTALLPEGSACASAGIACAKGLDCIQLAGGFCAAEYVGVCTARPTTCDGIAKDPICTCDGDEYRNECQARSAGYTRILVPCHLGSG